MTNVAATGRAAIMQLARWLCVGAFVIVIGIGQRQSRCPKAASLATLNTDQRTLLRQKFKLHPIATHRLEGAAMTEPEISVPAVIRNCHEALRNDQPTLAVPSTRPKAPPGSSSMG